MKLTRNAFTSDTLTLTWRDLFLLAIGKTIGADKALITRRKGWWL